MTVTQTGVVHFCRRRDIDERGVCPHGFVKRDQDEDGPMTVVDESGAIHFCEHDWRRDPYAPVMDTYPPMFRAVCAKCGTTGTETERLPDQDDPTTWPKAKGDVS